MSPLHARRVTCGTSAFSLAYKCNSALPTELYLSQRWRYPFGFNLTVTPQPSCNVSHPEENTGVVLCMARAHVCVHARNALNPLPPAVHVVCAAGDSVELFVQACEAGGQCNFGSL